MKNTLKEKITETKRQLILQEVSRIFETEGIGSVTMQQIAKEIGISVGSLYNLFDSKEALYSAYVDDQIRRFHEEFLRQCPSGSSPRKCLERYIRLKFDTFRSKRKALEEPAMGDPLFFLKIHTQQRAAAEAILADLAKLFALIHGEEPLKEDDSMKVAYLFNAFTTGYIEYWLHYEGSLQESEEEVLDRFLRGVVQ